jgi:hypothetical protein
MYAGHFDFTVPLVQRVPEVWSAERCASLVARVEEQPWVLATVNAAEGRVVQERLRNNDVCVLDDAALADDVVASVRPHLPAVMHAEGVAR